MGSESLESLEQWVDQFAQFARKWRLGWIAAATGWVVRWFTRSAHRSIDYYVDAICNEKDKQIEYLKRELDVRDFLLRRRGVPECVVVYIFADPPSSDGSSKQSAAR